VIGDSARRQQQRRLVMRWKQVVDGTLTRRSLLLESQLKTACSRSTTSSCSGPPSSPPLCLQPLPWVSQAETRTARRWKRPARFHLRARTRSDWLSSAEWTRHVLDHRADGMATLGGHTFASCWPGLDGPSASDLPANFRVADLAGRPHAMLEYFAPGPANGSLYLLLMPIS
jgi:hypothetical protein